MSSNRFIEMSAEEIVKALDQLDEDGPQTADQVDAIFEELKALDADKYKRVIDLIEKEFAEPNDEAKGSIDQTRQELSSMTADSYNLKYGSPEDVATLQAGCQAVLHLLQIKGNDAHPMIKAVAQEIAKLSDKEYGSAYKLDSAFLKAYDTAYAPNARNPFRAAAAKKTASKAAGKRNQPQPPKAR